MRIYQLTGTSPVGRPGNWGPRELAIAEARRLEGALAVRNQLTWIAQCNETLAGLDVSDLFSPRNRGVAAAVAIGYRQCFNSGTRKFRLKEAHVRLCPSHSTDLHAQIIGVANKAIAHAESWLDQVAVCMCINQAGELSGLHIQQLQAGVFRKDEHEKLVPALQELVAIVADEIARLETLCRAHAEKLSPSERLAAAPVMLVPPSSHEDGIRP